MLDTFLSEKLNEELPLYIVSHQGFILGKVLNMSKDEDNNIYIKNCNVISNLNSNKPIKPKFKPDENISFKKQKLVLQFDSLETLI